MSPTPQGKNKSVTCSNFVELLENTFKSHILNHKYIDHLTVNIDIIFGGETLLDLS